MTKNKFKVDRDYLPPIPTNQLTLNPKLGQNPGW
ncbi:RagB/SusD family nutrient uptake outer membrane protein [Sphingobacterium siyangense]